MIAHISRSRRDGDKVDSTWNQSNLIENIAEVLVIRTFQCLSRVRGLVFFVHHPKCRCTKCSVLQPMSRHTYVCIPITYLYIANRQRTEPHPRTRPAIRNARHGQWRSRTRYQLMGNTNSASENEATRAKAVRRRVRISLCLIFSEFTICNSYWTLHFDASPHTLRSLNGIMRRDPRVLRWTVLKLADKLEDLARKGEQKGTVYHLEDVVE